MAKALFGHVGAPDPRLVAEVQRLRRRVRDLEDELERARALEDVVRGSAVLSDAGGQSSDTVGDLHPGDLREPALA
jgi:hypothetical protein